MLHIELASHGVFLRASVPERAAFWEPVASEPREEAFISDAVFVDDLCLILLSDSPRSLLTAVHTVLRFLVVIFRKCALDINWAKGKTEAFIKLRGRNAASFYQSL